MSNIYKGATYGSVDGYYHDCAATISGTSSAKYIVIENEYVEDSVNRAVNREKRKQRKEAAKQKVVE